MRLLFLHLLFSIYFHFIFAGTTDKTFISLHLLVSITLPNFPYLFPVYTLFFSCQEHWTLTFLFKKEKAFDLYLLRRLGRSGVLFIISLSFDISLSFFSLFFSFLFFFGFFIKPTLLHRRQTTEILYFLVAIHDSNGRSVGTYGTMGMGNGKRNLWGMGYMGLYFNSR